MNIAPERGDGGENNEATDQPSTSRVQVRYTHLLQRIKSELSAEDYDLFLLANHQYKHQEIDTDTALIRMLTLLQHKPHLCNAVIGIMDNDYIIWRRHSDNRLFYSSPTMQDYLIPKLEEGLAWNP